VVIEDADPMTYYLAQHSRTGYVWVTYHATRSLAQARQAMDADERDWAHHRVLDVRTGKVHQIRRPGWQ
jgi:hypothetical protein